VFGSFLAGYINAGNSSPEWNNTTIPPHQLTTPKALLKFLQHGSQKGKFSLSL
jgi:hypothetical protein